MLHEAAADAQTVSHRRGVVAGIQAQHPPPRLAEPQVDG